MLATEFIFTYLQEVSEVWRIDFFVLGSDPQSGHTKKMQLILFDFLAAHELVDDMLSDVEGLRQQSEFAMHVDDPFN